jgi:hypothetical protein
LQSGVPVGASGLRSRTLSKRKKPPGGPKPPEQPAQRRPEIEVQQELVRQLREWGRLDDEAGYWAWVNAQPGYDPNDEQKRLRAAEAWKAIVSERQRWLRRY